VVAEASFAAAFAGGVLALLAPCSALLLPAFFAYAFANRTALVRASVLFLLGLCTVLLPLGLVASLAGALFIAHRQLTILAAGLVLIALGTLQTFGATFPHFLRVLGDRVQGFGRGSATYATGVVYGMTGFCSGPLLGSVLTLAAAGQDPLLGALLLLVYALGMATPLLLLSAIWDRYDVGQRRWLRGRGIRAGPIWVHTNNLLAGGLFVLLGATFIASQGGALLSGTYDDLGLSALGFRVQEWVASNL
jgi:cytochrome c biogenesis protein CcdA